MRFRLVVSSVMLAASLFGVGCGRHAIVQTNLPIKRVVIYRNGVAYFERAGHIEEGEVRFRMKHTEVGDFLATLAVMEKGGSSVRSAAFPLKMDDDNDGAKPKTPVKEDKMKTVVLTLDGNAHDLQVGYIAEAPVWRPSYRLVVQPNGEADLQAWGIVQNLSGEDWKDVQLSLVAGAPISFEAQLARAVIPERPTITDMGEVIAAVPRSETSLKQGNTKGRGAASGSDEDGDAVADKSDSAPAPPAATAAAGAGPGGGYNGPAPPPPPPSPSRVMPSAPRNVRSLAAVAVESGTTRYDLPATVTVPDKSATMVLLLAQRVPGEAIYLFAPDGGVPESVRHPFRVARFANRTAGSLERGPIAVFETGSFLGQGLVDPLPAGATATVPFALERAIAMERETQSDELGERIAKIENGQLYVERDAVTKTKYRIRSGADKPVKVLVKHPRVHATRLFNPPKETEDNVGTDSALVPTRVGAHATVELIVDERAVVRRYEDWFSFIADNAVKAYLADPRSPRDIVAKLAPAWVLRNDIVVQRQLRVKLERERHELSNASDETRKNLRAIEKSKGIEALQKRLTTRLLELVNRLDELSKNAVESSMKLTELEVRFREAIRDITIVETPPPSP